MSSRFFAADWFTDNFSAGTLTAAPIYFLITIQDVCHPYGLDAANFFMQANQLVVKQVRIVASAAAAGTEWCP
jgi:hypothetical protein